MDKYSTHIEKLTAILANELCNFCNHGETYNPLKENSKLLWDEMHLAFDELEAVGITIYNTSDLKYEQEIIYRCARLLPRDQKGLFGERVKGFHEQIELHKFLIEQRDLQKEKLLIKSEVDSFVHVAESGESAPEPVNELGLFYRLFTKESASLPPPKRGKGRKTRRR